MTFLPSDTGEVAAPRSMLTLPMLSATETTEPLLDGRETLMALLLPRESRLLRPFESLRFAGLLGDLTSRRRQSRLRHIAHRTGHGRSRDVGGEISCRRRPSMGT